MVLPPAEQMVMVVSPLAAAAWPPAEEDEESGGCASDGDPAARAKGSVSRAVQAGVVGTVLWGALNRLYSVTSRTGGFLKKNLKFRKI